MQQFVKGRCIPTYKKTRELICRTCYSHFLQPYDLTPYAYCYDCHRMLNKEHDGEYFQDDGGIVYYKTICIECNFLFSQNGAENQQNISKLCGVCFFRTKDS